MKAILVALLMSAPAHPREVLVYLGNEPAPTAREAENIRRIVTWLQDGGAGDQLLAAGIVEDLRTFPAAVDTTVRVISRYSQRFSGAVVATNRLLQSGTVLVARGGELAPMSLAVIPPVDGREASSPLSAARNVARLLDLVVANFDVDENEFVVVVESHGDEVYAITPRLGLPTEGLTQEALLARVHSADNPFVERFGIGTAALLAMLAEKRRTHGLRTSLLVLASCKSTVESLPPEVPRVLVAAGGGSLPFGVINYEWVLNSTEPSLQEAFVAALTPTPFEIADPAAVVRRRTKARLERLVDVLPYFGPLAAWLGAFVWWRRSRASRSSAPH